MKDFERVGQDGQLTGKEGLAGGTKINLRKSEIWRWRRDC